MHPYVAIPLSACVASAMVVVAILNRDVQHRANRLAALLVSGAAIWAFFEVLWNTAEDPTIALWLVRASTLGWVWFGPLGLHLFVELAGGSHPRIRRALPATYGIACGFLLTALATSWMHPRVQAVPWGWAYVLGPAYWGFYPFTIGCLLTGFFVWLTSALRSPSVGERNQLRWLVPGIVAPLVVASVTDGILPLFDIQVPRLGTASFTVLGAVVAWGFLRHGYSLLAPGAFAREIVETLPDGLMLLRLDGRIRAINGGLARMAGTTRSALEGMPATRLIPDLRLDPPAEVNEVECELRREGEPIPVSVSSSILRDKQGFPIGLVVLVRDLREVVALRSRLVTSGRLAAVGELAAGIAHEINNPIAYVRANLTSLQGFLDELRNKRHDPDAAGSVEPVDFAEAIALIEESLDGVDRVGAIVRDIKGFSHAGKGTGETLDLNALLDSAVRVASPQLRYTARIERRFGEIPLVFGSPQELKQVFLNLILNASQALGEAGTIRLITEHWGEHAVVRVEDDGEGMPSDVIERIFDPFFTTKPVGDGTGLGLAISYRIIQNHGGDIVVSSKPSCGTCVRVRLPIPPAEGDAESSAAPHQPGRPTL